MAGRGGWGDGGTALGTGSRLGGRRVLKQTPQWLHDSGKGLKPLDRRLHLKGRILWWRPARPQLTKDHSNDKNKHTRRGGGGGCIPAPCLAGWAILGTHVTPMSPFLNLRAEM